MASTIRKIQPEDIEVFSLQTHPTREFISSSTTGVTGNVYVFSNRSERLKEPVGLSSFSGSMFGDVSLTEQLRAAKLAATQQHNNNTQVANYFSSLRSQPSSERLQQQVEVRRFVPGVELDDDMQTKVTVVNSLFPYYRTTYPSMMYGFHNHNSLNFFTSSVVPSSSVLLYPNPTTTVGSRFTGPYVVTGAFSFDFWINPRYTTLTEQESFKPGTIFHLSSCYAVSLVTGSSKDPNGLPDKFRLLLQLSNSTDISPSLISYGSLPQGFSFISEDNCLEKNTWSHITIRWGTSSYNFGSGSFLVNGTEKGTFCIPSSSITPNSFLPSKDNPTVLCIGNYYEGLNTGSGSLAYFFGSDTSTREGLTQLINDSGFAPTSYKFNHPLNAELQELKIYNKYLTNTEVNTLQTTGPTSGSSGLLFYLPPWFTNESPTRTRTGGFGGVLETPFFSFNGTTTTPFAVEMAWSVDGFYTNLENYTREFVQGVYPRLWDLSGSVNPNTSIVAQTANDLLYATGSVRKRLLTVLPSDNGSIITNYKTWFSNLNKQMFVNDLNNYDPGLVSLKNMISTSSLFTGLVSDQTGSLNSVLQGATPTSFADAPGETFTILQRTRDACSNKVVFFDISNLFYGDRIYPGSVVLSDSSLSCSGGRIGITLKDDKQGNLYRTDLTGSHPSATWASVGNVLYDEGIVVIKHPQLFFFGKEQFYLEFKGDRTVHVLHFSLSALPGNHVSSSNPAYLPVSASNLATDQDQRFVYITGFHIHDDNMNVIVRSQVAQPVMLKSQEKLMFKTRIDF